MIRVHLITEGEPIYTLEYKKNLKALETALSGRGGHKMVVIDGLRRRDCPDSLFNVLKSTITPEGGYGVVIFLNDFDARKLRYK